MFPAMTPRAHRLLQALLLQCAKHKIHFATQHSPLERAIWLTHLAASRSGGLADAFTVRMRAQRSERLRPTDDDASIRGPEEGAVRCKGIKAQRADVWERRMASRVSD
jgi:hypothetical protein